MQVISKKWNARFDPGRNYRAKIGYVVIPNEMTIEAEMIENAPEGVGMYFNRVMMPREISTESLAKCVTGLAKAASEILPDDHVDVICYACTSGTIAMGEERTLEELRKGAPYAKPTTLASSVVEALRAVGAKKIVAGCPYTDELATNAANFFEAKGFEILDFQGLNLDYDTDMIKISTDFIVEFARAIDRPEADTILLSCGAPRFMEKVQEIEEKTGKHVICSNQAMLWNTLRMAGINDKLDGLGRLFKEH